MKIKCTPEERKILDTWPVVTAEDIQQMNDLFPHYIFYRPEKSAVNFWTSCCGRTERIEHLRRRELPFENKLLDELSHNRESVCPWCGRPVTMKDLRKSGKRRNLDKCECAILLHAKEDGLYGDAVVLKKIYETDQELTAKPTYWISSMYRFASGDVMQIDFQTWENGCLSHEQGRLNKKKLVKEPFKTGSVYGYQYQPYAILNQPALKECPITRYSCYFDLWKQNREYYFDFVSYLTAYCIYPRQIEMLVKGGLDEPVRVLIYIRKRFADAIKWEEPDIRKAMGLTGQELREVVEKKPPMHALELRNIARRWFGLRWTIQEAVDFLRTWGEADARRVLSLCRHYALKPQRLLRYLEENCVVDADLPWMDIQDVFNMYKDYLEAAWFLGMCMEHSQVLYPDDLQTAHDKATAQWAARMEQNPQTKGGAVNAAARMAKYCFEMDELRIVFPSTAAAIRREGEVLRHCVGGYAERHMKGVITILFLRQISAPNQPYVTIEMHGNRIAQVHGYRNDIGRPSARMTHKKFFDTWLAWLDAGSKRDKDGQPVLPKQQRNRAS